MAPSFMQTLIFYHNFSNNTSSFIDNISSQIRSAEREKSSTFCFIMMTSGLINNKFNIKRGAKDVIRYSLFDAIQNPCYCL